MSNKDFDLTNFVQKFELAYESSFYVHSPQHSLNRTGLSMKSLLRFRNVFKIRKDWFENNDVSNLQRRNGNLIYTVDYQIHIKRFYSKNSYILNGLRFKLIKICNIQNCGYIRSTLYFIVYFVVSDWCSFNRPGTLYFRHLLFMIMLINSKVSTI